MKRGISHIIFALIVALLPTIGTAQDAGSSLKFRTVVGDYGHIREDGGSVVCRFEAVNKGTEPVAVIDVVTSCGCTSVKYERKPIEPGEEFTLDVRFDPMNRPGRIDRTIYIRVSDCEDEIRLKLDGEVTPREKSIDELYPFDMGGGLRIALNHHDFGYLQHGKSVEERIGYVNTSDRAINISLSPIRSSGALSVIYPKTLEAGASGDIILRYRLAENSTRYGTLNDQLRFVVDGTRSEFMVSASTIAVDNFDLTDDISAPKGVIPKNIIKFGEINLDKPFLEQRLELRNEGEESLVVRATESSSDAVRVIVERGEEIAAGKSIVVTIRLYPAYITNSDNPFTARVVLITNDPRQPMKLIRVNALPKW